MARTYGRTLRVRPGDDGEVVARGTMAVLSHPEERRLRRVSKDEAISRCDTVRLTHPTQVIAGDDERSTAALPLGSQGGFDDRARSGQRYSTGAYHDGGCNGDHSRSLPDGSHGPISARSIVGRGMGRQQLAV
jgi:hypothetical protein